jgi:UDP-N-acetylmuramoyl-tripeptide--D-alanyl-D-alanine ligase
MDARELSKLLKGRLTGSGRINSVEFDSRMVKPGSLFVPLRGKRDGHAFIGDAFKRGAVGTLTEKPVKPPEGKFAIVVDSTLKAFETIAKHRRSAFKGKTVALTGSVGKTTTKELIHHLFSHHFATYRNIKSYNNLIGVLYTLSNLPAESNLYIQELGTNAPGEIGHLSSIVEQDIAIVTAVETAHVEGFKTFEKIVEEKMSITAKAHTAIVPHAFAGHSRCGETITFGRNGDVKLTGLAHFSSRTEFSVDCRGRKLRFTAPVPGYSLVNATLIAVALAMCLGVDASFFPEALKSFTPLEGRLRLERLKGVLLIDDTYNANPRSVENAIKVLSLQPEPRVAVLADMAELGEYSKTAHEQVAELLQRHNIQELIAFGTEIRATAERFRGTSFHFTDRNELVNFINSYSFLGKSVLVKGSRFAGLEEVCELIRKRYRG